MNKKSKISKIKMLKKITILSFKKQKKLVGGTQTVEGLESEISIMEYRPGS